MAPRCGAGHCGCGGRAPPPEQSQARCDRAHLGPARRWTRWGLGVSGTYGQLGALRFRGAGSLVHPMRAPRASFSGGFVSRAAATDRRRGGGCLFPARSPRSICGLPAPRLCSSLSPRWRLGAALASASPARCGGAGGARVSPGVSVGAAALLSLQYPRCCRRRRRHQPAAARGRRPRPSGPAHRPRPSPDTPRGLPGSGGVFSAGNAFSRAPVVRNSSGRPFPLAAPRLWARARALPPQTGDASFKNSSGLRNPRPGLSPQLAGQGQLLQRTSAVTLRRRRGRAEEEGLTSSSLQPATRMLFPSLGLTHLSALTVSWALVLLDAQIPFPALTSGGAREDQLGVTPTCLDTSRQFFLRYPGCHLILCPLPRLC